jgi:predicted nucleotide-binding protein
MNLFLSKAPGANDLIDALQAQFKKNDNIELSTKNLVYKFKYSYRLFNIDALEKALEKPDYALVILSEEYINDEWLITELTCLFALQQSRNKETFIIPVYTNNLVDEQIPNFIKEANIEAVDIRSKTPLQGAMKLYEYISNIETKHKKIFIGHGRSYVWKDLVDIIENRLGLVSDAFEREVSAGKTTHARIHDMLESASFAFLVMTAEDTHADNKLHARENVIHEIGLFQGKLGPEKAIILLEDGCQEFGNIVGLTQIRFPKGDIMAKFIQIHDVLKANKLIV